MNDGSIPLHATLEEVYALAQADAQRMFGAAPAVPRREALRAAWWWAIPIVMGAGLLWLASQAVAWRAAPAAPEISAHRSEGEGLDEMDEKPPRAGVAAPAPAVALPEASLAVGRARNTWRIDAVAASRLQAARQLAALSGSTLRGATDLLIDARPLTLQWQGNSLAEAWHAVFGSELNYILNCPRQRCEVWILTAQAPSQAVVGTPAEVSPRITTASAAPTATAGTHNANADDRIDDGPRGDLSD